MKKDNMSTHVRIIPELEQIGVEGLFVRCIYNGKDCRLALRHNQYDEMWLKQSMQAVLGVVHEYSDRYSLMRKYFEESFVAYSENGFAYTYSV